MRLLAPGLLALAALALPLIAAFLHRRRAQRRRVPALLLLRAVQGEPRNARAFAVPRRWLALALCLLAFAGAVFAAADPALDDAPLGTVVFVLDTTASMGAVEPGQRQSRLQRAAARLLERADALPRTTPIALVTRGEAEAIALRPTQDRRALRRALDSLQPRGAAPDEDTALTLAAALCADSPQGAGDVLFATDGAHVRIPDDLPCPVSLLPIGEDAPNLGITQLAASETDALGQIDAWIEVAAAHPRQAEARVDLYVNGALVDVAVIPLPDTGRAGRAIRLRAADGARLEARLQPGPDDALAADDTASVNLRGAARARVLLLTANPDGFLAAALRLHPRVTLTTAPPDAPATPGPWQLVVAEDAPALPLPDAPLLFALDPATAALGLRAEGPSLDAPTLAWWSLDHPLLRYVDLESIHIQDAHALATPEGCTPLARDDAQRPLLITCQRGAQTLYALGLDTRRSDLALRIGFANLIANLIDLALPADPAAAAPEGLLTLRETQLTPQPDLPHTRPLAAAPERSPFDLLWRLGVAGALLLLLAEWTLPLWRRRRRPLTRTLPASRPETSPRR